MMTSVSVSPVTITTSLSQETVPETTPLSQETVPETTPLSQEIVPMWPTTVYTAWYDVPPRLESDWATPDEDFPVHEEEQDPDDDMMFPLQEEREPIFRSLSQYDADTTLQPYQTLITVWEGDADGLYDRTDVKNGDQLAYITNNQQGYTLYRVIKPDPDVPDYSLKVIDSYDNQQM